MADAFEYEDLISHQCIVTGVYRTHNARNYQKDRRIMDMAESVSKWSKDPSTKVGSVLVDFETNRVESLGYNGFPMGVLDDPARYMNRDLKYKMVVHAEANAIVSSRCLHNDQNLILFSTHFPCNECAKLIIQAGIQNVVTKPPERSLFSRYAESYEITCLMFSEAMVGVILMDEEGYAT